jgi:dynein heavy chain
LTTQSFKRINFSSATTPFNYQENIESELEKKQVKTFQPLGGKVMTVFLDDLSMPAENKQGDQVTLEISRQLIEQRGFYYLSREERGYFREVIDLKFLAAMIHPGGGRNSIPNRMKRHFFSINMTPPSQKSIVNIYGQILGAVFNPKKYKEDVIGMKDVLIDASIEIWN